MPDHIIFAMRENAGPAVPARPELAVLVPTCGQAANIEELLGGPEVELLAPLAGRATAAS